MLNKRIFQKFAQTLGAVAIVLGLTVAAQAQANWKDRAEYDAYTGAAAETDPNARLTLLNTWKQNYPDSQMGSFFSDLYLVTYQQLDNTREAFDTAVEMRQSRPSYGLPINVILSTIFRLESPTDADLAAAEETARYLLANADEVFSDGNQPITIPDLMQWQGFRPAIEKQSYATIAQIYLNRMDYPGAERELKTYLEHYGNETPMSFQLAQSIQRQEDTSRVVEAMFHFLRAGNYTGEGAIDAAQRGQVQDYAENLYKSYTGMEPEGERYEELVAIATNNTFPPNDWAVESAQQRVQREFAEEEAWAAANPDWDFWNRAIVVPLTMFEGATASADAEALFTGTYEGALIPGEAGAAMSPAVTMFRATILAPEQPEDAAAEPVEFDTDNMLLYVGDPERVEGDLVANVTLINAQIPEDLELMPGMMIEFSAVPTDFTLEPFMMVMDGDQGAVSTVGGTEAAAEGTEAPAE